MDRLALALALVGCGDNNSGRSDSLEVHVSLNAGVVTPGADLDVVFHDADGIPLLAAKTDADGVVVLDDATDVAMVTALYDYSEEFPLGTTIMGVRPGDRPQFEFPKQAGPFTPVDLAITLPPNAPTAATIFGVTFRCDSFFTNQLSFTHTLESDCRRADGMLHAFAFAEGVDGQLAYTQLTVPGNTTTLTFPAWQTEFSTFAIDYTNAPTGVASIDTALFLRLDDSGSQTQVDNFETSEVTAGASVSRSYRYASGLATSLFTTVGMRYSGDQPRPAATYTANAAVTASATVDLGSKLLAPITGISASGGPQGRPLITWTQTARHDDASFGRLLVSSGKWTILFPPESEPSIQVAQLPDELARFQPINSTIEPLSVLFTADSSRPTYQEAIEQLDSEGLFEQSTTAYRSF